MDVVYYVVGFSLTVVGMLGGALYWLGAKFKEIDKRFETIERELKQIREGQEGLKKYVDERSNELRKYVDSRFEEFRKYIDARFVEMKVYVDGKFDELKKYVDDKFSRLLNGFSGYQEFFLEFLTTEDVIDRKKAELARGELWRIIKLVGANPLSKEEVERLKELIQKDELTYEEALWLREVARRLIIEYGTPETWKLHAYASIWVALARKRMAEERGEARG
ncbi:hypothetical protein [Pyrobaculum aerophilum]|uniref:PaREP5ab n=1 Tax=Pyrobaculum aerophilum TaxID=13773 RepID=A0A371QU65_9CREN|nr:hypothetical protein [Pyrobaculum aerophilum]RFA92626.1 hypothetical protein CGL51_14105 [Pyrobaculum aerophilum]RFA99411.1 hypothetical protein CGL52_03350 [Pyrobaculum aerophilum]